MGAGFFNFTRMEQPAMPNSSAWRNRPIEIWKEKVMFSGRLVDGIKMQPSARQSAASANGGGTPGSPAPQSGASSVLPAGSLADELNDEIPFVTSDLGHEPYLVRKHRPVV
jgi:hypothetical protein